MQAGCALVGGETAEHPGVMGPDDYDISGTGVGVVNADAVLGPERVRAGDVLIAMGSSGCTPTATRWCGTCCSSAAGCRSTDRPAQLGGRTLGDELLEPTRIYALDCLALAAECGAHAVRAHHRRRAGRQPGPGAAATACDAVVDRVDLGAAADLRPGRTHRRRRPRRPGADLQPRRRHGRGRRRPSGPTTAEQLLADRGVPAWRLGEVRPHDGRRDVELAGDYAGPAATGPDRSMPRRTPVHRVRRCERPRPDSCDVRPVVRLTITCLRRGTDRRVATRRSHAVHRPQRCVIAGRRARRSGPGGEPAGRTAGQRSVPVQSSYSSSYDSSPAPSAVPSSVPRVGGPEFALQGVEVGECESCTSAPGPLFAAWPSHGRAPWLDPLARALIQPRPRSSQAIAVTGPGDVVMSCTQRTPRRKCHGTAACRVLIVTGNVRIWPTVNVLGPLPAWHRVDS